MDAFAFFNCGNLFSIELPKYLKQVTIDDYAQRNSHLRSLRNIAIPLSCALGFPFDFDESTELGKVLTEPPVRSPGITQSLRQRFYGVNVFSSYDTSTGRAISDALKHRFHGLPIHKICYYKSYHPTERIVEDLKSHIECETGMQQDCLGMTPLHILACSKRHDVKLYQFILERYPENLVTKDKWGDLPILYALWGNGA